MRALAFNLMAHYGKSVTIEDPVWRWDGDLEVLGPHKEHPEILLRVIRDRRMELPSW